MKAYKFSQFFILVLLAFVAFGAIAVPKTWAADNPTEIRFIVNHADCDGGTVTFEFFVSETSVGVYPSTQNCYCNSDPLIVALNDSPTLSLIGPVGCTSVSMTLNDPNVGLALGYVRVEIDRTESGTETFCLVDYKTGGTCGDRNLCDGLEWPGTFSYSNILNCPDSLEITPADGLGSSGYEGGPFEPSAKNYLLVNTDPNSLNWTAAEANDMPWLDVEPNSGTLEPNQNIVVSVSINANADSLAVGSYGTDVIFANLTSGINHVRTANLAVRQTPPDGWASMNGGTTGGAGGAVVTVTTAADLKTYVESPDTYIVQVLGTLDLVSIGGSVNITSNKTIRGIGTRPTIIGKLAFVDGSSNIIIEKLNITNPYLGDSYDGISVKVAVTNLFITRCSIYNCGDGCIDITEHSDFITVSWCKFYYDTRAPDVNHRFVNLIGAGDGAVNDIGKLRVTMHHNWWSTLCKERMPRVRYGQVHVYNNYYGCSGNHYCIGVGCGSHIRVENNYFDKVRNPWADYYSDYPTYPAGEIGWNTGNVFYNTSIPTWAANNYATIFTPPYPYGLDNGNDIKAIVMAGAGAPACYGDFINLGIVNKEDLEYFLDKYWLASDSNLIAEADYYADGIVNFREFALLAENWMYIPPDIVPPEEPAGFYATGGDGTILLNWYDNSEPDVAGYNVYRSETGGSGYTKLNGSLLTNSNYIDNTVTNETVYYYVVTAVDTSDNESAYSDKVWAIPLGAGSIIIQENETGFCGVDGMIASTYTGYTGDGYCMVTIAAGNGIDWSISVPSDGTYTFKWRYSLRSGTRTPRLLVNDVEVVPSISFPATGDYSIWSYVSEPVDLLTGTNNIRLESTGSGIPYIDYILITGDDPSPASCP